MLSALRGADSYSGAADGLLFVLFAGCKFLPRAEKRGANKQTIKKRRNEEHEAIKKCIWMGKKYRVSQTNTAATTATSPGACGRPQDKSFPVEGPNWP